MDFMMNQIKMSHFVKLISPMLATFDIYISGWNANV